MKLFRMYVNHCDKVAKESGLFNRFAKAKRFKSYPYTSSLKELFVKKRA